MEKQIIIDQYCNSYSKGHVHAKFLLMVYVNGTLVFSKNFSYLKDADNLGFDMIKAADWYILEKVHNVDYEIIDLSDGKVVGSQGTTVLYRKKF